MLANFNTLRALARAATADAVTPGLAIGVGVGGQLRFVEAFGCRRLVPEPQPATPATMWDLASLTKPLATGLLTMRAIGAGQLDLEDTLGAHLPWLDASPVSLVTVRQVLSHSGGFVAHQPFYAEVLGRHSPGTPAARASLLHAIASEPLAYQPGTRSLYSDLGFILMGEVLVRRLATSLEALTAAAFALAGTSLRYGPVTGEVAPTERCPVRGRVVEGEVHDLNAYALGGAAGHAGLFGTVEDVARLAGELVAAWRARSHSLVDPSLLRLFWSPAGVPGSTWRLAWDGPAATNSIAGDRLSRAAVGHLGFTGCSLWIDPERETYVVVLSNRIHPTVRDDPRFRQLRRALNDAALEAVGY